LEVDGEILDDEWRGKIQSLSKNIPEQNIDVLPLVSSKYSSEQNVSFSLGSDSLVPLVFKNWKCSLKFLGLMELSQLLDPDRLVLVDNVDHWVDPAEEQLAAAICFIVD